jgi:hypothetical protein
MTTPIYTLEQSKEAERIKAVVRRVMGDAETRIFGRDAVLLMAWAHGLTSNSAPACQHQNIEVYKFNADRFSGGCRDCGADVRSQA